MTKFSKFLDAIPRIFTRQRLEVNTYRSVSDEQYAKANANLAEELPSQWDPKTLELLKKVLREDLRALSHNPIAKQVIRRYLDIAELVGPDGEQLRPFESSPVFRDWVNSITTTHVMVTNANRRNRDNSFGKRNRRHD